MNKFEEQLINNGIIDSPLTKFEISDYYDKVTIEYEKSTFKINCTFKNCFETNFKHDLSYTKQENDYKYFVQDIVITEKDDFFYIHILAWPFDGKIVCKEIDIEKTEK
ncbi:hypothetical protein PJ311_18920 [Bacillus sp. CLL-7-23]|uniref:Uncharacterized protein n=1 Tax=Bacillus changyiensis TaxID=3004103 RepID=A0ABT4X8I9_9BACI|nr:hypothetical protein [Bacillus changyiensis]MDA7028608.1 hypothetical protein [Bacillus changyiensis]